MQKMFPNIPIELLKDYGKIRKTGRIVKTFIFDS